MNNWLQTLLALFQLAPQVVTLVGGVEAAIGTAPGTVKKAVVMAPVVASGAPPHIVAGISGFIDHLVAAHKTAPAAIAPPAAPVAPVAPAAPAAPLATA